MIGRIKSKQARSKKIVITAHIDTARADYPHHPKRVTSFRKLAIMNMIILIFIFLIYFIGALFDLSNISPFQYRIEWLFSLLLVIPTLYSSFLLVLREWRYEIVPGANDNASGVSVALEMMASYVKNPLQETEVTTVFTGSEEVNCYGMIEFLKKNKEEIFDKLILLI